MQKQEVQLHQSKACLTSTTQVRIGTTETFDFQSKKVITQDISVPCDQLITTTTTTTSSNETVPKLTVPSGIWMRRYDANKLSFSHDPMMFEGLHDLTCELKKAFAMHTSDPVIICMMFFGRWSKAPMTKEALEEAKKVFGFPLSAEELSQLQEDNLDMSMMFFNKSSSYVFTTRQGEKATMLSMKLEKHEKQGWRVQEQHGINYVEHRTTITPQNFYPLPEVEVLKQTGDSCWSVKLSPVERQLRFFYHAGGKMFQVAVLHLDSMYLRMTTGEDRNFGTSVVINPVVKLEGQTEGLQRGRTDDMAELKEDTPQVDTNGNLVVKLQASGNSLECWYILTFLKPTTPYYFTATVQVKIPNHEKVRLNNTKNCFAVVSASSMYVNENAYDCKILRSTKFYETMETRMDLAKRAESKVHAKLYDPNEDRILSIDGGTTKRLAMGTRILDRDTHLIDPKLIELNHAPTIDIIPWEGHNMRTFVYTEYTTDANSDNVGFGFATDKVIPEYKFTIVARDNNLDFKK